MATVMRGIVRVLRARRRERRWLRRAQASQREWLLEQTSQPASFVQCELECRMCGATYVQETDGQGRLLPSLHDCATGEWEPA